MCLYAHVCVCVCACVCVCVCVCVCARARSLSFVCRAGNKTQAVINNYVRKLRITF